MIEHGAEGDTTKGYWPHKALIDYTRRRLKLDETMKKVHEAGEEFSVEINRQDKSLRTEKVRILHEIVFPAMADLVFFFEAIARNENLQSRFKSDVEDLLGIKYNESQMYGFMFSRLLRSILTIGAAEAEETTAKSKYDFQLRLNHILQGIVLDKVRQYLPDIFQLQEAQIAVKDDIRRAWAWTGTLAYNITERKEAPHRTFNFDTKELLK
jgi:hypothetical protein